jgi:hypothetical protein
MSEQRPASRSRSRSAAGDRGPWLIAIVVSIATFMVVLDTAIANVSLRYVAGSLAVSVDESTWIVTTYRAARRWIENRLGGICPDRADLRQAVSNSSSTAARSRTGFTPPRS